MSKKMPRVKADPDAPGGVARTSTPLTGGANAPRARPAGKSPTRKRKARRVKTDPDDRAEHSSVRTAALEKVEAVAY